MYDKMCLPLRHNIGRLRYRLKQVTMKLKDNTLYALLCIVAGVVLASAYSYTLDTKLDLNGDNAAYISLARNMAAGEGYAQQTPQGMVHVSHFPPGYPAILSVFMRMGIDNLLFFKVLNAVFLFAAICLLLWALGKATRQRWVVLAALVLACLSPQLLHFAGMAMSEMSYLLCMALSIFCLWQYSATETPFWRSAWFWAAIVTAMCAYHIRTVGMALMLAIVVFLLFRKEWAAAGASVVSMVVLMLPWALRNAHYGIQSRYFGTIMTVNPWRPEEGTISSVGEFAEKMLTNLDETVIKGFPEVLFPFLKLQPEPSGFWGIAAGLLVLAVIVWGAWNTGRLRWLMLAFLAGNIGLFALWHGGNGTRYVTPIIPFVYVLFYNGLFALVRLPLRRWVGDDSRWGLLLLLMALPMRAPLTEMHKQSAMPYNRAYRNYFRMATELDRKLPAGTVVSSRKPDLFRYYAPHLIATNYRFDVNPDTVIAHMVSNKVDYVILEQLGYSSTPRYLLPAVQARPGLFPIAWQLPNPDTYLLRFERGKAEEMLKKQD